jgi:predicted ATPase/signal transduction histidine kinase
VHARGVVHRDINPFNWVVAENRTLTLIDFDGATAPSGMDTSIASPPQSAGLLLYMSPEQTGRMNRLVDHRSDLYGLGATFYEMLTGGPPFPLRDPIELMHAHLALAPVSPSHKHLTIPAALSGIVLKLLAKMPEERYQSAEAVVADLEEAERRWKASGTIVPFELGRVDLARQLPPFERIVGREDETHELLAALERVLGGANELVLVSGPAGIGKSALIEDLRTGVLEKGVRFLRGKFDLAQGSSPYTPITQAFGGLLQTLLAEPENLVASSRDRIQQALGARARVITEVIPELERLIGEQPAIVPLGPVETDNRFHLVFHDFVQAVATRDHPLVLFIDDLQWADGASLTMLQRLVSAPDLANLLVLGAHREVGSDHPLTVTIAECRNAGATVQRIALGALSVESVTRLLAGTLRCDPPRVRPLAALIHEKTAGNPFFMQRLLRFLQQTGLLSFEAVLGTWNWDLAEVGRVAISDNVADLLIEVLRKLPQSTQEILEIGACIGHTIPLDFMASLLGQSIDSIAPSLFSAVHEGLLVPADREQTQPGRGPSYKFAHDRIQHAAYSLLPDEKRKTLHLRIGRKLREALGDQRDEGIFEVVDHLDRADDLVTAEDERLGLVALNVRAAERARASSALGPALSYLQRAIAYLPDAAWGTHRELAFSAHRNAAECAFFSGNEPLAERLLSEAYEHSASLIEQSELLTLRIDAATVARRLAEAIDWGRRALGLFGVELCEPSPGTLRAIIIEVEHNLRGRKIPEIRAAPPMQDPRELACMRVLSHLIAPAYQGEKDLMGPVVARMVDMSLTHGNSSYAGLAYVCFGLCLASVAGDYETAHELGLLGVEVARLFGDPVEICKAGSAFGLVVPWRVPLRNCVDLVREQVPRTLELGEFQYYGYAWVILGSFLFYEGAELPRMLAEFDAGIEGQRKTRVPSAILQAYRQAARCLSGLTPEPGLFNDAEIDEASLRAYGTDTPTGAIYQIVRLQVSYLFGDWERALGFSIAAESRLNRVRGFVCLAEHAFYTSLVLAAMSDKATPEQRREWRSRMEVNEKKLAAWAANCPQTFHHKHLLLQAELARLSGDTGEAAALYDRAVEAAREQRFLQDEALANELAGRFYMGMGRARIAHLYLSGACDTYARRGATAKVEALEREFPELEVDQDQRPWDGPMNHVHLGTGGDAYDLSGILKAAEAISAEVVLDRLLEKLMAVCLATGGAQHGALVLEEDGIWMVRVLGSVGETASLQRTPLATSELVPRPLVEHVQKTGEVLVLADAAHHGIFASDPYVARERVRSLLVLPVRHQGQMAAILFLRNDLATSVFTPERVKVLELLSSQIAISLRISLLFEKLTQEVTERRRAEAQVRFLADAGAVLGESLDYETTLSKLAQLAIPTLADWCVVDLVEEGQMRRIASRHADPGKVGLLRELEQRYPADWSSPHPAVKVIRSAKPLFVADATDELGRIYSRDAEHFQLLRELGVRSMLAVPLIAHERVLGAISLVSGPNGRRYGAQDLALAEELARRAAEAIENAKLYRDAQTTIHLRDEFLTIAAHELYTPITSLVLATEALLRDRSPSGEKILRTLRTTHRQGLKLARLIGELLDWSRIQVGRFELALEEVDLAAEVREVGDRFQPEVEQRGGSLIVRSPGHVIGTWDRVKVEQVVTNLLSNAIKFGADKPIEIAVEEDLGVARLVVEDHGIGIPDVTLPHIFERFERGVSVSQFGGLGLGLYLVREIVRALGGSVGVRSRVGQGSTFTVELPLSGPASHGRTSSQIGEGPGGEGPRAARA